MRPRLGPLVGVIPACPPSRGDERVTPADGRPRTPPDQPSVRLATTVPLLDLAPGTIVVLREVLDGQSRVVLCSLGLTEGARLKICRLGDPCIIQVRSTRIGLSKAVAQSIYVAVAGQGVR